MNIGVIGGTFDPPHIGHQILAAEAQDQLNLDQVYWVLTQSPPHKTQQLITGIAHRKRMVELAIEGNPIFGLSDIDMERKPPHYAVDTMELFQSRLPGVHFYYLMGSDSFNDLLTWHRPYEFVHLCKSIVVMMRERKNLEINKIEKVIPDIRSKLLFLNTPIIEISATQIRLRIKEGRQFRYLVPEDVYKYILEQRLYKD